MRRLIALVALGASLLALAGGLMAQERVIISPNSTSLSLEDLSRRSDDAEAKLRELSAIVEAAIACQEQSKRYVPAQNGSGSCADIEPARIYCTCLSSSGGNAGDSGNDVYDGYGNIIGSGGGGFNHGTGGDDHNPSTGW